MHLNPVDYVTRTEYDERMYRIDQKFDELTETMLDGFDRMYSRFDVIDQKFDRVDRKFEELTEIMISGFDRIYDRFDGKFMLVDKRFDAMDTRFDRIEKSLEMITTHLGIKKA